MTAKFARTKPSAVPPPEDLPRLWRLSLDRWSESIDLALPLPIDDVDGAIAFIDLATRQTHVNFGRLSAMGVLEHLPCVLAHEIGHHIRYPHTIAESRRMLRFLREIVADVLFGSTGETTSVAGITDGKYDWLLNVFFDLLINDELSDAFEDSFVAIFRAMRAPDWSLSFGFYIAVFEELWNLDANAMLPREVDAKMAELDSTFRERARSTGEFVRGHPENRPLQLARFLVALRPFLVEDVKKGASGEAFEREPVGGGVLDVDSVSDLMRRRADEEQARRWLREAVGSGALGANASAAPSGGDPLVRAKLQLQGLASPDELAISIYRREAEKADLAVPQSFQPGELVVPGPHEPWEMGDDLEALDWLSSVVRAGGPPIPGVNTLLRTRFADEPKPGEQESPWIELYIDSSGSMPNPVASYSQLVQAGFILVHAATRAGGRVRVIQYASQNQRKVMATFTRAARPAYRALVEFICGGTDFPWDELESSTDRYKHLSRVRRVVISDGDFVHNTQNPTPTCDVRKVIEGARRAGGFTAILNSPASYTQPVQALGVEVVNVVGWTGIDDAARALAEALFRTKEAAKR